MEFNFIGGQGHEERDKELFFGPLTEEDRFILIQPEWTMADVMVQTGIFPSLSQARKNGFGGPIPKGFSDRYVGKLKRRITILNWK